MISSIIKNNSKSRIKQEATRFNTDRKFNYYHDTDVNSTDISEISIQLFDVIIQ